jgi:hypothetical protein
MRPCIGRKDIWFLPIRKFPLWRRVTWPDIKDKAIETLYQAFACRQAKLGQTDRRDEHRKGADSSPKLHIKR